MALGDISAVIDTLEWDSVYGLEPTIAHRGGDIYVVAYRYSNSGWVASIEIQSDGTMPGPTYIDRAQFENNTGWFPQIIHISGDVFAVVARDTDNDGWVRTIDVDVAGDVGAVIDSLEFDPVDGRECDIIPITGGDNYLIAWFNATDNTVYVGSVEILANGQIGASLIDTLNLSPRVYTGEPHLIHISGNTYACVGEGGGSDGFVVTFEVLTDGQIGAAIIDYLEFDTTQGLTPRIVQVVGDIYAIVYERSFYVTLKTVDIDAAGNIGSVKDTLQLESALATNKRPKILKCAGGDRLFLVSWSDESLEEGMLATVLIESDGSIAAAPEDTQQIQAGRCRETDLIEVGTKYAVVYRGPDDDGWAATFDVETPAVGPVNIAKVNEVAAANIGEVNGSTWASIGKVNGVA